MSSSTRPSAAIPSRIASATAQFFSARAAWRAGDIETFGRLCFESGRSSIYSWEAGSEELRTLYHIMTETEGIYGGRFSGAGFKGCCLALINPDYAESIEQKVGREYLKAFPKLEGRYSFHLCDSTDGIRW